MSSRKKDKNEWLSCPTCEKFYAKPSLQNHQKICQNENGDIDESLTLGVDDTLTDGFSHIYKDVFKGKLREADSSQNMLPHFKIDTILMHPNTIKCANFQISSRVEVIFDKKRVACTVWPCSLTNLETAVVSRSKFKSLACKSSGFIQVKKFPSIPLVSSLIKLKPIVEISRPDFEEMKDRLAIALDDSLVTEGETVSTTHYGINHEFNVSSFQLEAGFPIEQFKNLSLNGSEKSDIIPQIACVSFEKTKFELEDVQVAITNQKDLHSSRAVGGLFTQKKEIEDFIILPLKNPVLSNQCGVETAHGIIFYGQTGTGKSTMARKLHSFIPNVHFQMVDASDLMSQYVGEAEDHLKELFADCIANSPSVLIIDDFEILCPFNTSNQPSETEKRIISVTAKLMDDIPQNLFIVVIAITNNISNIHPQLRRSGRFDKDIEFTVPNRMEREDILRTLLKSSLHHSLSDKDINEIVNLTQGFVPADLKTLCKEASLVALRNRLEHKELLENDMEPFLNMAAYRTALLKVRPSAMKVVTVDIPKVYWSDVGGQSDVKEKLRECIEWPLKFPDTFKRMGISSPKGLLMYGPPGCSKTLVAKALATESGLNFISIKGPELFNKYLGESERAVRDVFKKARAAAPSIVFFDEIDALGIKRAGGNNTVGDRVLAQLLTELDGVEGLDGVIIVAATNRPDVIDSALLRPGRIDRLIYVPLPDAETRKEIFQIQFRSIPVSENVSLDILVEISDGYSGAEICALCREAVMTALREDFECVHVKQENFVKVFSERKPGVSTDLIKFYDNFASDMKSMDGKSK